ncbi:MAG TPA: nickel-dependent hydrogenase large subunit [Caldimonas sp.]|nr:nickel-dependent hydrogenase large subunit [Caldimonas sp.]
MELEGALRIGLGVREQRVETVRITSTRPDAARLLLQGRRRKDIRAALPRLFSVCGQSQAAAGELACTAAAGESVDAAKMRCNAEVSAEMVREHAWCVLLDWPRWCGEQSSDEAIAAARSAEASRAHAAVPVDGSARAISMAAFGADADEWLEAGSAAELHRWIDAGRTGTARFMRRVRDAEAACAGAAPHGGHGVGLLDGDDRPTAMRELWAACEADPDAPRLPVRNGRPYETGALARLRADPLIAELACGPVSRVFARFAARLRELASLLAGRHAADIGVQPMPPTGAAAWVENARGLLVHHVRLDGEVATTYRIVAPTEWNFHPRGALAMALVGAPAPDRTTLEERAVRAVRSLDPCVGYRLEIAGA